MKGSLPVYKTSIAYLGTPADTTIESAERYTFLLLHNILQEAGSSPHVHVFNGMGCLPGVLEMNTQMTATGLGSWKTHSTILIRHYYTKADQGYQLLNEKT